jgi:hypothetical protein
MGPARRRLPRPALQIPYVLSRLHPLHNREPATPESPQDLHARKPYVCYTERILNKGGTHKNRLVKLTPARSIMG